VLLGLASTPGGVVRRALLRRGVLADELRARVAQLMARHREPDVDLTRSPLERVVQAVRDEPDVDRPISTTDILRAVAASGDSVADAVLTELGGAASLLYAASAEELRETEPARVVPAPPSPRRADVLARQRAGTRNERVGETVAETFELLLEIRGLLRALADRQISGEASALELRVAGEIEAAVASARFRLADERRGLIGSPRGDDMAQRRLNNSLRDAYRDALQVLGSGETVGSRRWY
jgi:hypothetical protein